MFLGWFWLAYFEDLVYQSNFTQQYTITHTTLSPEILIKLKVWCTKVVCAVHYMHWLDTSLLGIPFTRGTFSELGIRFIQTLVVEEVWRVEWEENCFQPKITLLYFTIRIPRALIIKTLSFFTADQKCHLAFFRPIFYDLAWSLFFLFFTWGWWESQTISLKCQNLKWFLKFFPWEFKHYNEKLSWYHEKRSSSV